MNSGTMRRAAFVAAAGASFAIATPALAAGPGFDGAGLRLTWSIPFAGLLLSIALFPVLAPRLWHRHQGKIAAFWALAVIVPMLAEFGVEAAAQQIAHTAFLEYIPFIILLFALFTVSGGILLEGTLDGAPLTNTAMLGIGAVLASLIGTTGASMVLIRPMIRANDQRVYNAHVFIFFIFIVSNIGGSLTPLGDPPLFLGFLKGVSFFWTTFHLLGETALTLAILLALFFALDLFLYRTEPREWEAVRDVTPPRPLRLRGLVNIPLLAAIVGFILLSASWKPGVSWTMLGSTIELQSLVRDAALLLIALLSLWLTPTECRKENGFNWGPIVEVAKLFAGIFICIIPALAILRAGMNGPAAPLVSLVTAPDGQPINVWYFWLTGLLSSFLDNAPTYLVFFNLVGGDAEHLMGPLAQTLAAISLGAVFMGANSYIGNAPNFMVLAICVERGIRMPTFFGYMGWSLAILGPIFIVITLVFFL